MSEAKKLIENLPDGWNLIKVGDILKLLPRPTRRRVEAILRQPQDVFEAARQLKPLLEPFASQLEANGMVAAYLSYALPFFVYQGAQQGKSLDDILREQGGDPVNN